MIRVRTVFTGVEGSPYYSNIYFGGSTSGEAAQAVIHVDSFWEAVGLNMCTPLVWQVEGDVPNIDPVTGDIIELFTVAASSGAADSTAEAMPLAAQGLVRLRTGQYIGGRELRGRIYIPYLSVSAINDGVLDNTVRGVLLAAAGNLRTQAAGTGGLVVWSRTHGEWEFVQQTDVWTQIAVLRSRRDS